MQTTSKFNQQGVVLVVSLLVLLIMTMIGLSAMRTTILEEKMAGNTYDKALAFQAAEAALRAGENYLQGDDPALGMSANELLSCKQGGTVDSIPCQLMTDNPDPYNHATYTTDVTANDYSVIGPQSVPPRFFITYIESRPWASIPSAEVNPRTQPQEVHYFHVTARGTGGSQNAQAILRSYFGRL